jgi:hypothetical protein
MLERQSAATPENKAPLEKPTDLTLQMNHEAKAQQSTRCCEKRTALDACYSHPRLSVYLN